MMTKITIDIRRKFQNNKVLIFACNGRLREYFVNDIQEKFDCFGLDVLCKIVSNVIKTFLRC